MTKPVKLSFAALLSATVASTLAVPAPASAEALTHQYRWATRTIERGPYAGGYDGVLKLRISADGTVQGTYRNDDVGIPVDVAGGLHGDRIWLVIGNAGDRRYEGTLKGGRIDVIGNDPIIADGRYTELELVGDAPANAS